MSAAVTGADAPPPLAAPDRTSATHARVAAAATVATQKQALVKHQQPASSLPSFMLPVAVARHAADDEVSTSSDESGGSPSDDGSTLDGGYHPAAQRGAALGGGAPFMQVDHYRGLCDVTVAFADLCFASFASHIQLVLRVSRDVLFAEPPASDELWSTVIAVPVTHAALRFRLQVAAFTSESKVIAECHDCSGVKGRVLLGLCVLPLMTREHAGVAFRSPLSAEAPVQGAVSIAIVDAAAPHEAPHARAGAADAAHAAQQLQGVAPVFTGAAAAVAAQPVLQHTGPQHHSAAAGAVVAQAAPVMMHAAAGVPQLRVPATAGDPAESAAQAGQWSVENADDVAAANAFVRDAATTLSVGVVEARNMPDVLTGTHYAAVAPAAPAIVVVIERFASVVEGVDVDSDWACLRGDATAVAKPSANPAFHFNETVAFGATALSQIGSVTLRVLHCHDAAWAHEQQQQQARAADGSAAASLVTSAELFARCSDVGRCTVDLRPLRYMPAAAGVDGWYHVVTAGGKAGQIHVTCRQQQQPGGPTFDVGAQAL
jgi:hypothetical protein